MDFDDILDSFLEFWTFEWLGELWEVFIGMWHIEEFSWVGIVTGLAGALLEFVMKDYWLKPFTKHMTGAMSFIITIVTFVAVFFVCYLIGAKMFED
jgi:hypothetical protein